MTWFIRTLNMTIPNSQPDPHLNDSFSLCQEDSCLLTRIPESKGINEISTDYRDIPPDEISMGNVNEMLNINPDENTNEITMQINSLPLEIISDILSYINTIEDIKHLRLVNRTWEYVIRQSVKKIENVSWITLDFLKLFPRLTSLPPIRFEIFDVLENSSHTTLEKILRRVPGINIMITIPDIDHPQYPIMKRIAYDKIFSLTKFIWKLSRETFSHKKIDIGLYIKGNQAYRPLLERFQLNSGVLCYPSCMTLHPQCSELIEMISRYILGINLYLLTTTIDYFKICPHLRMIRISSRTDYLPHLGQLLVKYPQIDTLFFQRWSGHYRQSLVEHFSSKLLEFLASVESPIRREMSLLLPFSLESLPLVHEKFPRIVQLALYDPIYIARDETFYIEISQRLSCSRLIVFTTPSVISSYTSSTVSLKNIEFIPLDMRH